MSRRRRRLGRATLHVLGVIGLVAISGITVQAVAEATERGRFLAPGHVVDIGRGQQVHLRVWGAEHNGPTIVAEASAGMFSSEWAWIGAALADDFRVVAVDRPGLGWSRGGSLPRDAAAAADALTAALEKAGIDPPYVVIGHSFGGLTARVFADLHGDEVIGLALLDATHPDGGGGAFYAATYRRLALIGHSGLNQLVGRGATGWETLPVGEVDAAFAVSGWTSHLDATADEMEAWDRSTSQARVAADFADLPLLVVSGPGSAGHLDRQRDLLGLSARSEFAYLPDVSHVGMLTDEAQARVLLATLRPWLECVTRAAGECP